MAHQKKLNQGLENKIIALQQKLTDSNKVNKEVNQLRLDKEALAKEVESLKERLANVRKLCNQKTKKLNEYSEEEIDGQPVGQH